MEENQEIPAKEKRLKDILRSTSKS